jgi:hypothetical protein
LITHSQEVCPSSKAKLFSKEATTDQLGITWKILAWVAQVALTEISLLKSFLLAASHVSCSRQDFVYNSDFGSDIILNEMGNQILSNEAAASQD